MEPVEPFQVEHVPNWNTFQLEHVPSGTRSKWNSFQLEHVPSGTRSKWNPFQTGTRSNSSKRSIRAK